MKKIVYISFLALVLASCGGNDSSYSTDMIKNELTADGKGKNTPENAPMFKFQSNEHDFGKVVQGEKLQFAYKFTNNGKSDLLISQASGSCGCTVAEFPQDPIKPGAEGAIAVTLNTEGKKGPLNKTIKIYANTYPSETILHVKAMVELP